MCERDYVSACFSIVANKNMHLFCLTMSWAVGGLMDRLGRPIRVRFRDQIRSYLGVKEPSLYKERRYVI